MAEQPTNDRFRPLTEEAFKRAQRNPELLARLRETFEALERGEPLIPATELMSKARPTDAGA